MSLFRRKTVKFKELPFRTDVHSHLLPGVDDGFKTGETSLSAIEIMRNAGVERIILTPHVFPELYPDNTPSFIRGRFASLAPEFEKTGMKFRIAGEHMIYEGFEEDAEKSRSDLLVLPDNMILIEMSYVFESYDYEGYGYASSDVAMGYSFNVIGYIRYDGNIGDFAVMHAMYDGPSIIFDDSFTSIANDENDTYLLSSIINEYYTNMAAFAQKYEGKTIIMDGVTIGQIDFADTLWVNLENGDIAVCSADVSEIAKIEVGRTYNIIGTFDLYADMQFTLNDCTFELVG